MATEIRVPALGESVTEATVGKWFKKAGDPVKADETLVELETDKVTLEVPAPASGVLAEIRVAEGETVSPGGVLGAVAEGEAAAAGAPEAKSVEAPATQAASETPAPAPAAQRLLQERNLDPSTIQGSGKRGQILKEDVLAAAEAKPTPAERAPSRPEDAPREERVRMTRLRQTIARRLKEAQERAAMLTTFNEVDMTAVMELRNRYRDLFQQKHGVKLGFMGFFVKAACHALKEIPEVNAEIDGQDIVYRNFCHVGVAVGTERGLVVPVVRDADQLSIAAIEKEIGRLGTAAREGRLALEDMQGGTFTISNGGVYGSLMSTPILNAPQSGILGMHKIQERPVAIGGKVEIRPMMYLALSYDHRIVDGQGAVTFLVRIKETLEDPERLVLDL